jgi:signal transduction histidine kinase
MNTDIADSDLHSDGNRKGRLQGVSATPLGPRPKLLIVDDEDRQVAALCASLRRKGYDVNGVTSGEAALEQLRASRFQLLLTDLQMPGLNGIELLRAARECDADLVAILMTGHATIDKAVEAMQAGALDVVVKPFDPARIEAVLSRALHVQRLQSENAALQQRLAEHVAELEAKNLELEAANQELDAFSHSVSHDLRAPLRAVRGFAQILLESFAQQMPPEAQRQLKRISDAAIKMSGLVDDLLRFARLDRHALTLQSVHIAALVHEAVAELRREHSNRDVTVHVGELPDAYGDKVLLKQVFTNLLGNAFKFTSQLGQPTIEVGCERSEHACVYFVRDNGVGFDMRHAGRLFGAFQRLHTAAEFEGTGIGLSLVKRIIDRHGGNIWAESALGKGATFRFTIER